MKKIFNLFVVGALTLSVLIFNPVLALEKNTFEVNVLPRPTEKVSIDFEIDADGTSTRIDKDTNFTLEGEVSRGLLQDGKNVVLDAWKNHVVQPTPPSKARGSIQEDVGSDNKKYPVRQEIKTTTTTKVTQNKTTQGSVVKTETTQNIENSYSSDVSQERPLADKREFLTFETATGKVFHLIIDREKDVEQVKLVTEVSEQDLLNMIEVPITYEKEVVPTETITIPEIEVEEKETERLDWLLYILIPGLAVGGYFLWKLYKEKFKNKDKE